jgi:hypothetical protein
MAGQRGWVDITFRPEGQSAVKFGDAGVIFPSLAVQERVEGTASSAEDIVGPIHIRVLSSNISAIPTFPKGQVGTFQGTYRPKGVIYSATNAKVIDSKPGDVLLEAESLDGVTSPVARARKQK